MIHIEWWQTTGLILEYSIKLLAIGIVPEGRRPSSSSAWLLAILLVPVVGLPLFLLMGSKHINARRHRVQREANAMIKDVHADFPDIPPGARVTDELLSIIRLNRTLTSMPAVSGESRGVLADYTESLLRMAEAIDSATSYVHMEIYIVAWDNATDEVFRAMERAVQRGVKVRLLFDQVGSWKYPGYRGLGKRLTSIGVDWHIMLPLQPWRWRFRRPDLRNHRKLLVIDGRVGFMGSQNLIDSSYLMSTNIKKGRHWVDVMVELTGPIVTSLEMVFAMDWYMESEEILIGDADSLPNSPHQKTSSSSSHPGPDTAQNPTCDCSTPWCTTPRTGSSCAAPISFPMSPYSKPSPPLATVVCVSICWSAKNLTNSWSATPNPATTRDSSKPDYASSSTPPPTSCIASS